MRPLKDPTYIVNKTICENVMQHNNLFGKTNKNYNKNIDLPTTQPKPKKSYYPVSSSFHYYCYYWTTPQSDVHDFDPYAPPVTPLKDLFSHYNVSPLLSDQSSNDDIIYTSSFEVPILPSANLYTTNHLENHLESSHFVDLITITFSPNLSKFSNLMALSPPH